MSLSALLHKLSFLVGYTAFRLLGFVTSALVFGALCVLCFLPLCGISDGCSCCNDCEEHDAWQDPNPDDPLNHEAAEVLRDNPRQFDINVKRSMAGGYVAGNHFPRCIWQSRQLGNRRFKALVVQVVTSRWRKVANMTFLWLPVHNLHWYNRELLDLALYPWVKTNVGQVFDFFNNSQVQFLCFLKTKNCKGMGL